MEKKNLKTDIVPPHEIELKNRKQLKISGVLEVAMATTSLITLKTHNGVLSIGGADLKIKNLNEVEKKVEIDGNVYELKYNDKKKKLLSKVFK